MQKLRRNAEISSLIASLVVASSLPPVEKARRLDCILTELIFQILNEAEKEKAAAATATNHLISILKSPEVEIIELRQEKTTTANSGSNK